MNKTEKLKVSLLTGGDDPTYALPLAAALDRAGILIDFIGNDEMENSGLLQATTVNYLNLRGNQDTSVPMLQKAARILKYYLNLVCYAYSTDSTIFHILWLNKFIYFDRTLLTAFYKFLGKKVVFTAHNVNEGERDGNDSFLNRTTLRFMYQTVDHIFVHTSKMKKQLIQDFDVEERKVTVIPFGIKNCLPQTDLDRDQAREILGLQAGEPTLLFFGQIAPYKGLEYLVSALHELTEAKRPVRLIIAGKVNQGCDDYWRSIKGLISEYGLEERILCRIEFIPDPDVEIYFKAADALALPYRNIFQSGPLFLAYHFGLPVLATDVGAFREDIIEGRTGFICEPENASALAETIQRYFDSPLFANLKVTRRQIHDYASDKYSWAKVSDLTYRVYQQLSTSSLKKGTEPESD